MFLKSHTDLDDELNRKSFFATLPRFAKRPAALDPARYNRYADFMKDAGLLDDGAAAATAMPMEPK